MMTHLQKFQQRLVGKADAALIFSPQNQRYLCDFPFSDGYLLIFQNKALLLTDDRYVEAARAGAGKDFTVLSPRGGVLAAIPELLKDEGAKSLLLEECHVTLALREALGVRLEGIELLTGASTILGDLRICKDKREIDAILCAQKITDDAFAHILNTIRPDMTEVEVALELEFFMRRAGSEGVAFNTIAVSGAASSMPHGVPRDVKLERGFLTMDFGARIDGYCADMTRTVVIGKADAEMKHLYETVLKAQRAALDVAALGVPCRSLDTAARDVIDGAGYEGLFTHSLGHGVGLDVHEAPRAARSAAPDELLAVGHVVTVEPGIYIEGKYGCRIEDMIVIGEDGKANDITASPKHLIELC